MIAGEDAVRRTESAFACGGRAAAAAAFPESIVDALLTVGTPPTSPPGSAASATRDAPASASRRSPTIPTDPADNDRVIDLLGDVVGELGRGPN